MLIINRITNQIEYGMDRRTECPSDIHNTVRKNIIVQCVDGGCGVTYYHFYKRSERRGDIWHHYYMDVTSGGGLTARWDYLGFGIYSIRPKALVSEVYAVYRLGCDVLLWFPSFDKLFISKRYKLEIGGRSYYNYGGFRQVACGGFIAYSSGEQEVFYISKEGWYHFKCGVSEALVEDALRCGKLGWLEKVCEVLYKYNICDVIGYDRVEDVERYIISDGGIIEEIIIKEECDD